MKVTIRKFESCHIDKKVDWINDPANNTYLHYDLPLEVEKTKRWYENVKDRDDRYDGVIEADGVAVGLIGLLGIDKKNRKAELYISMGESAYKGKGIAKKAIELLLRYAFGELGLSKVYLYTETANVPAQRLFERVGFLKEGLLRNDIIYNNKKVDRFAYGLLAEEFCTAGDPALQTEELT